MDTCWLHIGKPGNHSAWRMLALDGAPVSQTVHQSTQVAHSHGHSFVRKVQLFALLYLEN